MAGGIFQGYPFTPNLKCVVFTATGLAWLQAFRRAVVQAQAEFTQAVGAPVATVVMLGLEAYAGGDGQ